jgi:diphosphate--fructose-6-phosphate 1-phosphotransferase
VPVYPDSLNIENMLKIRKEDFGVKEEIKSLFETLLSGSGMQYVEFNVDVNGESLKKTHPVNIGCVLSGGQAPGGHNVISGLYDMIKAIHPDSKLIGFLKGPHGIFTNNYVDIEADFMNQYRNMGGFDMIMSGRDKIESPKQFEDSLKYCTELDLNGLVVIGGDDSNTNACLLAEYFNAKGSKCKVIGAPKTIDGDLKNEYCEVSFGFDTATKTYSEQIGNIIVDTRSTKKYHHFIRLMGRSASHIALECYLQTRADLVLIGEEIFQENRTLKEVTNEIVDVICKRHDLGKDYGVYLIPEGIIEFFPEMKPLIEQINEIFGDDPVVSDPREYVLTKLTQSNKDLFNFLPKAISDQLLLDRDPHGNVQVAKIETEILMILLCQKELEEREAAGKYNGTFQPQSHYFGYEGRCAIPSNFDAQYCYAIGRTAAALISMGYTGYMAISRNLKDKNPKNWIAAGCPLPTMMGVERRKGQDKPVITKYVVELDGPMYNAYKQFKDRWAIYDCGISPGPIQLHDPRAIDVPFLVCLPDINQLELETNARISIEKEASTRAEYFVTGEYNLSQTAKNMFEFDAPIPRILESGTYACAAVREARAPNIDVEETLHEQYPHLSSDVFSTHFVEIVDQKDEKIQNDLSGTENIKNLAKIFAKKNNSDLRIGVVICGRQAPGMHNVIDGLLRFSRNHGKTELIGFTNGTHGFFKGDHVVITDDNFSNYK